MAEKTTEGGCAHNSVSADRCHLHYGWCGVCNKCGARLHAPLDVFVATGNKEFRVTKFHEKGGSGNG